MQTPRQTHLEACEQLQREVTITFTATAKHPDGTTAIVDWPEDWEASTFEDADAGDEVDLWSNVMELAHQAVLKVTSAVLGPCPAPNEIDIADLRARMIAFGMDPDDPDGLLAGLIATSPKD